MQNTFFKELNSVSTEPVRLKWSEKDRTVIVEPEDEDRFTMKVNEVIESCNIKQKQNEFEAQFTRLKNLLGNWIHEHEDKIANAFVTVRDTRILFLVIAAESEYDSILDDQLTELDWEVSQTPLFSLSMSVQLLPFCDKDVYVSFFSPPIILEYCVRD